jgi:hypothetical protein
MAAFYAAYLPICNLYALRNTQQVEKKHRLCFYFCGFNFTIIAGLLLALFGCILGFWHSLPALWIGVAIYTPSANYSHLSVVPDASYSDNKSLA